MTVYFLPLNIMFVVYIHIVPYNYKLFILVCCCCLYRNPFHDYTIIYLFTLLLINMEFLIILKPCHYINSRVFLFPFSKHRYQEIPNLSSSKFHPVHRDFDLDSCP